MAYQDDGVDINYSIVRSKRRTVSIMIRENGEVEIRAPYSTSNRTISEFVESKRDWIEKNVSKMKQKAIDSEKIPAFSDEERRQLIDKAMQIIPARVSFFAPLVGVSYGNITIRNQKTIWGSCSGKGNLNFNYLLAALPEEVLDYVVVHELCHRLEMNHSSKFWTEVERVMPDYKKARKWLKENGNVFLDKEKRRIDHADNTYNS